MIGIISPATDAHTIAVQDALPRNVTSRIVDLARFPIDTRLSITFGAEYGITGSNMDGRIDFAEFRVVWWRRPGQYSFEDCLGLGYREFAYRECHETVSGLLLNFAGKWMNSPWANQQAAHKVHQLHTARNLGLDIPQTLISNDPSDVRRFVESLRPARTVCKSLTATERHWRETRIVGSAESNVIELVRHCPAIFQQYIEPGRDLRVTIVGDDVFAASIDPLANDYEYDWRFGSSTPSICRTTVPDDVAAKLLLLVRSLGLVYAAVDIRVGTDGRFHVLEVNPGGQWLFIEEACGLPITRAVASWLTRADCE